MVDTGYSTFSTTVDKMNRVLKENEGHTVGRRSAVHVAQAFRRR